MIPTILSSFKGRNALGIQLCQLLGEVKSMPFKDFFFSYDEETKRNKSEGANLVMKSERLIISPQIGLFFYQSNERGHCHGVKKIVWWSIRTAFSCWHFGFKHASSLALEKVTKYNPLSISIKCCFELGFHHSFSALAESLLPLGNHCCDCGLFSVSYW